MSLTPGANLPVPTAPVRAVLSWQPGPDTPEIDVSALLLGPSGTVRDDADLVFYNQPRHLSGAVRVQGSAVEVDLADVEADVERIVLAASADGGTFGQVDGMVLQLVGAGDALADFPITAAGETALIGGELYRRGEGWKFRAIGQGYDSGLAGLATDFGIAVDDGPPEPVDPPEPTPVPPVRTEDAPGEYGVASRRGQSPGSPASPPPSPSPEPPTVALPRPVAPPPPPPAPELSEWPAHLAPLPFAQRAAPTDRRLEERKALVAATLARQGAADVRARVVLVLDASGSMSLAYLDGVVARIVERVAPIAAHLDIGVMPVWKFADTAQRLPDLHVDQLQNWVGGLDYHGVGLQNDEPAAIRAVLEHVGSHDDPTLVLFFADGDVRRNVRTSTMLRSAAAEPVFWQFVGLGPADFTRFEKLDRMSMRKVDNCGFAAVREPDRIPDGRFYDLLLAEFPRWLAAARTKGVL
jgi:stress response protein SCP2